MLRDRALIEGIAIVIAILISTVILIGIFRIFMVFTDRSVINFIDQPSASYEPVTPNPGLD